MQKSVCVAALCKKNKCISERGFLQYENKGTERVYFCAQFFLHLLHLFI
jgi:hypothetical protein